MEQSGFSYGCGYYQASAETMEEIRALILSDDEAFIAASRAVRSQDVFSLRGDMYKRSRYPDESAEKREWLERKSIYVSAESGDFGLLFSDSLAGKLKEDFPKIADVYRLFAKAEDNLSARRFYH